MKKKLCIVAVVLCLLCTPLLSACSPIGKTNKLKLVDYSISIAQARTIGYVAGSGHQMTQAIDLGVGATANDNYIVVRRTQTEQNLYSLKTHSFLLDESSKRAKTVTLDEAHGCFSAMFDGENNATTLSFYKLDGTELASGLAASTRVVPVTYPLRDKQGNDISWYYQVTDADTQETTRRYFYIDENGNATPADELTDMTKNDVTARREYTLANFTGFGVNYKETDTAAAAYRFSTENNNGGKTLYIRNAGSGELKTLTLPAGTTLAFYVDGKIIYEVRKPVPYDAEKGYNYIKTLDPGDYSTTHKFDVHYYSFEIAKKNAKPKELKLGYIIESIQPLFNTSLNKYNALAIKAVPTVNDIATYATNANLNFFITDSNGKVGYDFTNLGLAPYPMIKLGSNANRFLAFAADNNSASILNEKGEKIASLGSGAIKGSGNLPTVNISEENELIVVKSSDKYGAANYDGKLVLAHLYSGSLNFFGKYAFNNVDGYEAHRFVTTDQPKGTARRNQLTMLAADEFVFNNSEGYSSGIICTQKPNGSNKTTTVYNYAGAKLTEIATKLSGSMSIPEDIVAQPNFSISLIRQFGDGSILFKFDYQAPTETNSDRTEYYIVK